MYSSNRGKKAAMRRPVFAVAARGFMFLAIGVGLSPPLEAQVSQWDQVMAGAKKEGKVVVSIPPGAELRKSLKEGFEKRFGIELELVTGRGAASAKKIADEFRAGLRLTDVHTGGSAPISFGLAGMLMPVEDQVILGEVADPKHWWGGHMYVDNAKRYGYSFLDSYSVQSENLFLTYSCCQKVDDF